MRKLVSFCLALLLLCCLSIGCGKPSASEAEKAPEGAKTGQALSSQAQKLPPPGK